LKHLLIDRPKNDFSSASKLLGFIDQDFGIPFAPRVARNADQCDLVGFQQ
jgi:hypothetical protein